MDQKHNAEQQQEQDAEKGGRWHWLAQGLHACYCCCSLYCSYPLAMDVSPQGDTQPVCPHATDASPKEAPMLIPLGPLRSGPAPGLRRVTADGIRIGQNHFVFVKPRSRTAASDHGTHLV